MAECLKEITLQALWQCEITEQEEEEYINDQVVPLNHMVRESYLNYLKQGLTKNLNMCSVSSNMYATHDIEKCAGLLELKALRLCMVTSLYQKAMLQMVADIKRHTKVSKVYHKFEEIMSQNCLCRVSKCKATQTDLLECKIEDIGNILEDKANCVNIKTEVSDEKETNHFPSGHVDMSFHTSFSVSSDMDESCTTQDFTPIPSHLSLLNPPNQHRESENGENCTDINECVANEVNEYKDNDQMIVHEYENKALLDCCTQSETRDALTTANCNISSRTSKSNPPHNSTFETKVEDEEEAIKQLKWFLADDTSKSEFGEALLYETATQELIRILESEGELSEEDTCDTKPNEFLPQTCTKDSVDSFWKKQRLLQKKKLHESISKMCCDPEAKVKMKNKFSDMFGYDSDDDGVWCSKEKIAQYKQRIAPRVVKHLLPYYKQKRILSRHVFKRVASHITDKLVCFKHFPEEADIEKGITLFFSYHGFIRKPEDVWTGWDRELQ